MHWFEDADAIAPALPAIWLVRTDAQPRNLTRRPPCGAAPRAGSWRASSAARKRMSPSRMTRPAGRSSICRGAVSIFHWRRAGIVAVGLAHQPLGVDIESVDANATLPLDLLHPDEHRFLEATASASRPLAFAYLGRESAYVKALAQPTSDASYVCCRRFISISLTRWHGTERQGALRLMTNGGQDVLATAAIVLD